MGVFAHPWIHLQAALVLPARQLLTGPLMPANRNNALAAAAGLAQGQAKTHACLLCMLRLLVVKGHTGAGDLQLVGCSPNPELI